MPFKAFNFPDPVARGIEAMGYENPTPIQSRAIPLLMAGRDVIGSAQTGTGKTAAFMLPLLSMLGKHHPGLPRVLVLEPTRELTAQVDAAIHQLARFTNLKIVSLYGGIGFGRQIDALKRGVDIVVATPGRLLDHIQRGNCNLGEIKHLVLDEADRMLDMGFLPDVRRILNKCPRDRQTALFSATIPPQIATLIQWAMRDPETIQVGKKRSPAETVNHVLYPVAEAQKTDLLLALLENVNYESVIVFCRTRRRVDQIAKLLKKENHSVATLHSDRTQKERERALDGFRQGKFEVLAATDIAARGLDILDVSHVVNFDVPQHPEDYVHRIGRTGRAEASGDAFTLMVAEDAQHVFDIERFIGQPIPRVKLEGFDYQYTAIFDQKPTRPGETPQRPPRMTGGRVKGGYSFAPTVRGRRRRRR